jgi:hypothetical protein
MWSFWPRIQSFKGKKMETKAIESTPVRAFGIELKTASDAGSVYALADGATDTVLKFYDGLMGAKPTFTVWEAARLSWRAGFASQREGVKANTIDKAWSRFATGLTAEKPKADNANAARVSSARVDPFKGKPVEEIKAAREAAGAKIAAGDVSKETAKEYRQAVDAEINARKEEEKAAEKKKTEALKPRRDAIRELASKADDDTLSLIEAAVEIRSADAATRARAWARLTEAAGEIAKPTKGKTK